MARTFRTWIFGSIKRQVVFVFVLVAFLYSIAHWQIDAHILRPQFLSLQESEAREDVQRCISVIEHEIHITTRKAADWAAWDDTYQFIQDLNEDFVKSNLVDDAFISLEVDMMLYCDPNGRIAWGRVFDWRRERDLNLVEFSVKALNPAHPLLQHTSLESVIEGVWLTEHQLMLVSSLPIITSEREGPVRGTLVMGAFLDPAMVEQWSQDLSISFVLEEIIHRPHCPSEDDMLAEIAAHGTSLHEHPQLNLMCASGVLSDPLGQPVLLVQAQVPSPSPGIGFR